MLNWLKRGIELSMDRVQKIKKRVEEKVYNGHLVYEDVPYLLNALDQAQEENEKLEKMLKNLIIEPNIKEEYLNLSAERERVLQSKLDKITTSYETSIDMFNDLNISHLKLINKEQNLNKLLQKLNNESPIPCQPVKVLPKIAYCNAKEGNQ